MPPLFNIPIIISLVASFGVFVHDARLDTVAQAVAVPVSAITSENNNLNVDLNSRGQHIHSENGATIFHNINIRSQKPATQPRNKDDKKYIAYRRTKNNIISNDYIWPSI